MEELLPDAEHVFFQEFKVTHHSLLQSFLHSYLNSISDHELAPSVQELDSVGATSDQVAELVVDLSPVQLGVVVLDPPVATHALPHF